jgi:hypothetical protein
MSLIESLGLTQKTVMLQGEEITLRPATLAQLARTFPLLEELATAGVTVPAEGVAPGAVALLRAGPPALAFLASVSGVPVAELEPLTLDEADAVVAAVWELNRDFFHQAATTIEDLDTRITRRTLTMLGPLLSNFSLPPATDSTISPATPGGNS